MKLNLGSGDTPKAQYLNFDFFVFKRGQNSTDVVGKIEDMPFKNNTFEEILCAHVVEHFSYDDVPWFLKLCYDLLISGGICIMEAPCLIGGYEYYMVRQNNIKKYVAMLFGLGPIANQKYGKYARHLSGWTGPFLAEAMGKIGFEIVKIGHGLTHGMGRRDFRVEGRKP